MRSLLNRLCGTDVDQEGRIIFDAGKVKQVIRTPKLIPDMGKGRI